MMQDFEEEASIEDMGMGCTKRRNQQLDRVITTIKYCVKWKKMRIHQVKQEIVNLLKPNMLLNNMETYSVEMNYMTELLKNWLKESLEKAFKYLKENKLSSHEMETLLNDLHSTEDFSKFEPGSLVRNWCEGENFKLINDQKNLYENTKNLHQLFSYFHQFKATCIDKIYHVSIENNSKTQLDLISALRKLLTFINFDELWEDPGFNLENKDIDGREFVKMLTENLSSTQNEGLSIEPLNCLIKTTESLKEELWTPQFKLLTKEICRRFLLPIVTFEEKTSGGKHVLIVKGTTVRISKVKSNMLEKMQNMKVEEVQIVGLATVHIDENLERENWHGINVAVLTEKLVIDRKVNWDVSGQDGNPIPKPAKETNDDDQIDGLAGEHGQPGESGGNVYVTYNQIIKAENWTIVSNGGRGSGGQNGQNGKDGKDGQDAISRKPNKEEFDKIFTELIMAKKFVKKDRITKIHNNIAEKLDEFFDKKLMGKSNPSVGADFYFHTFSPVEGGTITAARKGNGVLILWKGKNGEWPTGGQGGEGGKGGQGGFGGNISVQKFKHDEKEDDLEINDQQTPTFAAVTTISVRGKPGEDGRNGQGGKYGKRGKSTGDVGFIKNLTDCPKWKKDPIYFGFEDEPMNFDIRNITKDELTNCTHPYTKCKLDFESPSGELYALYRIENLHDKEITQTAKTTDGRQRDKIFETLNKKAITLQSLIYHLNDIINRMRTVQRLNQLIENRLQMNIKEIVHQVMDKYRAIGDSLLTVNNLKNASILHQKSMESRRVLENVQSANDKSSEQFEISNQEVFSQDINLMESLDKQVYDQDYRAKYLESSLQQVSHLLELQPTKRDTSSILHATFGRQIEKETVLLCDNVKERRNEVFSKVNSSISSNEIVEDYILQQSTTENTKQKASQLKKLYFRHVNSNFWQQINDNLKTLEEKIVERENENLLKLLDPSNVHSSKGKVVVLLRHCLFAQDICDVNQKKFREIINELNQSRSKDLKDLVMNLNKEFNWVSQYKNWEGDYKEAIQSKPLSLAEMRLLIKDNDNLITSYSNVNQRTGIDNCDDQMEDYERLRIKCSKRTLSLQIPTEIESIMLYRDNEGNWQRLDCHPDLRKYCDGRIQQIKKSFAFYYGKTLSVYKNGKALSTRRPVASVTTSDSEAHRELLDWLKNHTTSDNQSVMNQITTAIKVFNPEYGCTPGELSRLLLNHLIEFNKQHPLVEEQEFEKVKCGIEMWKQLAKEVWLLTERVVDYDSRNIDPIIYLTIVAFLNPQSWKYEFLLLEMEERMKEVLEPDERAKWRRKLYTLNNKIISIFQESLRAAGKPGNLDLDRKKMERTIELLVDQKEKLTRNDFARFSRLLLNDWLYELKTKMWQLQVSKFFSDGQIKNEQNKEAVYILLELENTKGEEYIQQSIINPPHKGQSWDVFFKHLKDQLNADGNSMNTERKKVMEELTLENMFKRINQENGVKALELLDCKLDDIKINLEDIQRELENVDTMPTINTSLDDIKKFVKDEFKKFFKEKPYFSSKIKNYFKKSNKTRKPSHSNNSEKFTGLVKTFLKCYIRAVQLISNMKIRLRNTQRMAIMTLLLNENNTLAQVSTGEGKSLIVAGVAIFHALCGRKIDIITSNNVLALRDSTKLVRDGGLKNLYETFGVDVAHNCDENMENRTQAYGSTVVYGELSNFQKDYLLDQFYGENIRGDRTLDYVIVDEVDCMLLDRGNNMLYLSHDIPGMEALESLYIFILEKIRTTSDNMATIKSNILYDLYGIVTMDDLKSILGSQLKQEHDIVALWTHLIKIKVIDQQGRLLIDSTDKLTDDLFNYQPKPEFNPKLAFFFRKVCERKRRIHIPQHLLSFVDRHLDTFLTNAVKALQLKADEDYVVDGDRTGSKLSLNPRVIIIDRNTGTDQTMSQWDKGLHQFLQLKERCRLTLQSLKAVFISNMTFIKRYEKLTGLTGTLGSQTERTFLQEMYECNYLTVPTAFPKQFTMEIAIVVKTEERWLEELIKETNRVVVEEKRSLVIFCQSIKDVNVLYQKLRNTFKKEETEIHSYTRDYQEFSFGDKDYLNVGHVIVATNLAGRGTDIKIDEKLRANGGLHICLTYLPDNTRTEEQAMGRAGRKGEPGSGRLILLNSDNDADKEGKWPEDKIFDIKMERDRQEWQRISRLSEEFHTKIEKQEICFGHFQKQYKEFKSTISDDKEKETIICYSVLDQWALWVDRVDFDQTFQTKSTKRLLEELNYEILKDMSKEHVKKRMTPAHFIALAKRLAVSDEYQQLKEASKILNDLVKRRDSLLYPAAHYLWVFVHIKLKLDKDKLTEMLRTAETVIQKHIDMQMSYSLIINQILPKSAKESFCPIDEYNKQKENNINILSHYTNSIHSLLGNRCSVSQLQDLGFNEENAKIYFDKLVRSECIVNCQVNKLETIPDREKAFKEIAKKYSVDLDELKQFLKEVGSPNEEKMKKKLEKTDMIRCTRRKFWDLLMKHNVLLKPPSFGQLNSIHSIFKDPNWKYVLFDPTPKNINDLLKGSHNSECAIISLGKELEQIDLTDLGKLTSENDLIAADITNKNERNKVWKALIEQNILDSDGKLSPKYQVGMSLSYPDCHIYEDAVMGLVEKTYVAEIVRRQWLKERDPIRRMKLITYLPLDPYQSMLCNLHTAHIISGNSVTQDRSINFKELIKSIASDEQDQKRLLSYLENHEAELKFLGKFTVEPIYDDIGKSAGYNTAIAINPELQQFSLLGFDDVIKFSRKKRPWVKLLSITAIGIGFVIASTGLFYYKLPFAGDLLEIGLKNFLIVGDTLIRGNYFTWADYRNRMFSESTLFYEELKTAAVDWITNLYKNYGKKIQKISNDTTSREPKKKIDFSVKGIIKSQYQRVGKSIKADRLIVQAEYNINGKLRVLCRDLEQKLNQKIVDINADPLLKKTLSKLFHQTEDKFIAEWNVQKNIEKIAFQYEFEVQICLTEAMSEIDSRQLYRIKETQESSLMEDNIFTIIKSIFDSYKLTEKLEKMIISQRQSFQKKIEKKINPENEEIANSDASIAFQNKMENCFSSKLKEEIGKTIESLMCRLMQKTIEVMSYQRTKILLQLKDEEWHELNRERINQMSHDVDQQHQTQISACVRMIKKTKDPNLLAALMRTNGVLLDTDQFFLAGFEKAKSLNLELHTLLVNKSSQDAANLIDENPSIAREIRLGWRNYVNQKCPFELFPVGGVGCINKSCALRGLNDFIGYRNYVKEAFVGERDGDSFDNMRKNYQDCQDYQNAIWLNIKTFMLPIAKRLSENDERRNDFFEAAMVHFKDCRIGENGTAELKQRLKLCVGNWKIINM